MAVHIFSASLFGFDCRLVDIEADILNGISSMTIVGLGDASVQESRERIRSAIKNSGAEYPRRKKVINLAPADIRKHGPTFDLPIALGLLLKSEQIEEQSLDDILVVGELSLDGTVRKIHGALAIADFAKKKNFHTVIVPEENAQEASYIDGIKILAVSSLEQLIAHLKNQCKIAPYKRDKSLQDNFTENSQCIWTFEDIRGHEAVKRALIIAAAGHHNILLHGPPGSGKTILAGSLAGILPPFTTEEALEVTKIYSVAGKLAPGQSFMPRPQFRAVHHTASTAALIGGGTIPRPGEISLAHRGVLFLDELLEFPRGAIDALRQPLEDGYINVSRAAMSCVFPADIMLVAATNPCPCGYFNDPAKPCVCTPAQRNTYFKKLSGPILDRIDITCSVPRLSAYEIHSKTGGETTADARLKVETARIIQHSRGCLNSRAGPAAIKKNFNISEEAFKLLHEAASAFQYSGRVYYKLLKVSRTIADIESVDRVLERHAAEALQYRPRWERS